MRRALDTIQTILESTKIGDDGVVKNVKILGFKSKNGYAYTKSAVESAVPLYADVKVYKDHADHHTVDEILGVIKNPRFVEGSGIHADFHANPKHADFPSLKWNIENIPNAMGFSHDAEAERDKATLAVVKITGVNSVDLVTSPATVNGMFESIKEGIIDDQISSHRFCAIIDACGCLVSDVRWSPNSVLSDAEKVAKIAKIYKDAIAELSALGKTKESEKKDIPMEIDYTKITEADLKKNAPALVEKMVKEAAENATALEKKYNEALAQVDVALHSDVFKEHVRLVLHDDAKLKKVIEDRKSLAVGKVASVPVNTAVVPVVEGKKDEPKAIKMEDTLAHFGVADAAKQ